MKKTYIYPTLEVMRIATQQMLAASARIDLSDESITDEANLLSREYNF